MRKRQQRGGRRLSESPHVGFSVVIPVHGRIVLLDRLLSSVREARRPPNVSLELIVVDSSGRDERDRLRMVCEDHGSRWVEGSLSVRQKRNLGARESKFPWLLFLDSDCQASAGLFEAYLDFVFSNENHLVAAAGPTQFRSGETRFTRLVADSSLLAPFRAPTQAGKLLWATTSNLLVRRDAFDQVGGFREELPFRLGGDDTDFCLRLNEFGGSLIAVPGAVCYHTWETWAAPLLTIKRSFRWGWMHSILLRLHPRFRRLDAPGLPVYTLGCFLISVIGALLGRPITLLAAPVFLLLAVLIHACLVACRSTTPSRSFISDLTLALVECPFGFGRTLGALSAGTLTGVFYRLDESDAAMDHHFPEMVRDLWSNNIALLVTVFIVHLGGRV